MHETKENMSQEQETLENRCQEQETMENRCLEYEIDGNRCPEQESVENRCQEQRTVEFTSSIQSSQCCCYTVQYNIPKKIALLYTGFGLAATALGEIY